MPPAGRLAVELARAGFSVVPMRPGEKRPAAELLPGRKVEPLKEWSLPPELVETLVNAHPELNWAVLLGHRWGLAVLDVDNPEAYMAGFYPIGWSPTVETGRGWHVWIRHPGPAYEVRRKLGWGEYLGSGYALLPGCTHPEGGHYRWATEDLAWPACPLAPAPPWLLEVLDRTRMNPRPQADAAAGHCTRILDTCAVPSATFATPATGSLLPPGSQGAPRGAPAPVDNYHEARSGADVLALVNTEAAARYLVQRAGRVWRGLGKAFRCFLPGHDERRPSAAIWRDPSGELRYRDYHARDGRGAYRLADAYAALLTGELRVLSRGEAPLWAARLVVDAGLVQEPDVGLVDSIPEASPTIARVWAGLRRLFAFRYLYDPSQGLVTPLTWRFLARWTGLPESTARWAVGWLLRRGYLQTLAAETPRTTRLRLFVPGPRAVRAREAVERLLAGVMEVGHVLVTNQSPERGEPHADGPGPVYRG